MASIFEKLKKGLAKTRAGFVDEIASLVKNEYVIGDDLLDKVEEILIAADIGVATAMEIMDNLKELINKKGFSDPKQLTGFLKEQIRDIFNIGSGPGAVVFDGYGNLPAKPFVIMMVGVNGTGKTTTTAKLAKSFHDDGKKVLLAAADTFRAAASEQLEIWAQRAKVDIVRTQHGGDPAAVAFDAIKAALARNADVLIVDTAGRLHTKSNLMEELKKIHRVLGKGFEGAPHEILLILDATTGQNAIAQAEQFKDAVHVTGIVVTKLDGTAKGGMVLALQEQLKLPVKFIGLGESMDDLKPFDSETFIEALFV